MLIIAKRETSRILFLCLVVIYREFFYNKLIFSLSSDILIIPNFKLSCSFVIIVKCVRVVSTINNKIRHFNKFLVDFWGDFTLQERKNFPL